MTRWSVPCDRVVRGPVRGNRGKSPGVVAVLTLCLGLLAFVAGPREAFALHVSIDTTALSGAAARLEFLLLDGDSAADNSVTISTLASTGTLGATDCSLGCSGGPPYTIDDAAGLGLFLQDMTLGTALSFDLVFTGNFAGGAPDRFTLGLLDPGTNLTLVDTNLDFVSDPVPAQDALLIIDLQGSGQIQVATSTIPPIVVGVVPEPATFALWVLGLAALALRRTGTERLARVVREINA